MKKKAQKKVPKRSAGGLATVKKYGSKHMSKIGKKGQRLKKLKQQTNG